MNSNQTKPYIIGITGGSGSGKTSFLNDLIASIGKEKIEFISQDNYYKSQAFQPKDKNGIENYDLPESLDLELFSSDIRMLLSGNEVIREEYSFNNPAFKPKKLTYTPFKPILILEGIFIYQQPMPVDLYDLKIFIDLPDHLKLGRRIVRDHQERGYSIEDILYQYQNHVHDSYQKYIAPLRMEADLVIPNQKGYQKALKVLTNHIQSLI